jgi:hypothetical protein
MIDMKASGLQIRVRWFDSDPGLQSGTTKSPRKRAFSFPGIRRFSRECLAIGNAWVAMPMPAARMTAKV